jgi:hypothetical protein
VSDLFTPLQELTSSFASFPLETISILIQQFQCISHIFNNTKPFHTISSQTTPSNELQKGASAFGEATIIVSTLPTTLFISSTPHQSKFTRSSTHQHPFAITFSPSPCSHA